jgi:hypothetical protein
LTLQDNFFYLGPFCLVYSRIIFYFAIIFKRLLLWKKIEKKTAARNMHMQEQKKTISVAVEATAVAKVTLRTNAVVVVNVIVSNE